MKLRTAVFLALFAGLSAVDLPDTARAASVFGIAQDDLNMNTLGTPYIHSRHTGLMPYWGPCYRCQQELQITSLTANIDSNGPGNPWTISGSGTDWTFSDPAAAQHGAAYQQVLSYSPSTGEFTGAVNLTGSAEIGYVCGGNSGLEAAGSSIDAMNLPVGVNDCDASYLNSQNAFGGPITLTDGTFTGNAIYVNDSWGTYEFYPSGHCVDATFNGANIGQMCGAGVEQNVCTHYAPTTTECQTPPSPSSQDLPTYAWTCDSYDEGALTGVCSNTAIASTGAEWIFGTGNGLMGTAAVGYSVMQAQYDNTASFAIAATLTFAAENYGWVWINGQQVGYTDSYTSLTSESVSMPAGMNTVDFMVMNAPASSPTTNSPAAGILSLTNSSGGTLLSTNDSDWSVVDNPPATPSPTPASLLAGTGDTAVDCASGACQ